MGMRETLFALPVALFVAAILAWCAWGFFKA
jgi:hypothetical protein